MKTIEDRFWAKVDRTEGCWNWTGSATARGYGRIQINGSVKLAHRVSFEMSNGPIAEGLVIDHTCHNHACVNPAHLRACTQKRNLENHSGAYSNSRSGVRGVIWHAKNQKWRVEVGHFGKRVYGGYFDSIADAEAAAVALRNNLFTHNLADRSAA
ncbi:endonuclease [Arthrobacter phage Sarge]|uniref:HNH endonuclease n=1 Tax=Arthrobacter phage Sarge TaxID=2885974 RepID=A0AAE8Y5E7_9CAUD|nr:endonuclease [Arthrobacter phage Sarge]UDL14881.1 HNH endonuclease [Arthrobacter phage Sarge]